MIIQPYLVVSKSGRVKVTKMPPSLDWDEVAIRIKLDLPKELFEKPKLEANISVPADAIAVPLIETEVIDNIQDIIKQHTGVEVKLQVISPEDNE